MWKHDTSKAVQYSPVVKDGVVYIGARGDVDYSVHALDAMTGEQVWAAGAPYPYGAEFAVTVANGKLYAPARPERFYALDASTGMFFGALTSPWGRCPRPQSWTEWST